MNIMSLVNALPGAAAQGLIWGIMAIGVYITYRILDFADLTVDGSLCTGGAVCIMLMLKGCNVWAAMAGALVAGMLAGFVTGFFHTFMGIPAILSGILTQLGLWSVNLKIMGKANQAINVDKYKLLVSLRFIKNVPFYKNTILLVAVIIVVLIAVLYWFFGTEMGCSLRATGCNDKSTGNQHRFQPCSWSDGIQWSCRTFWCTACPVPGLCRYQHGPRRHRHWSGCSNHRRGDLRQDLP